ncbi:phage holin family protein [Acinetobacter sichuanensis]|uniref:Phage holin family protein n=1 Tax=Acinetobacter sichuanensis TaxID=2136183 RepID=A0A371YQT7_9GAMM|nr:phage holin family protein [Acinetobacter sichuanensis]RFC83714.1 phage holin family protein [Acinetobacter sichuanensis]
MIEILFQAVALIAYLFCGLRIICFNSNGLRHRPGFSVLATILIASFMGQSVHILYFKDPVTLWDAVFAVLLAVIIYKSKGNVAKMIWSAS